MNNKLDVHPVDEKLPLGKLSLLGILHVLVMYAGAVAVPLIIGGALKLPKEQLGMLINADLFACGLVTLVQALGFWRFGIKLPVMMGVTFAAVSPMIVMATNPEIGLLGIYGAVISAGVFGILVAPLISRMLPAFPPVVTGSIITVIGISLMRIGITWAAGAQSPTIMNTAVPPAAIPNPAYGAPLHLAVAAIVLVFILLVTKFVKGFFANISVLLGLILGMIIAIAQCHGANLTKTAAADLLLTFSASLGGRFISQCLIGWIPGWGNTVRRHRKLSTWRHKF